MSKRVACLMSGGVDSSVAAALLKEQGYDVFGVYILGWLGTADFPCPWQKEEADARAVAELLEIPFYTVNLSQEYKEAVIDQFFAGYRAGVTPNPDILCNREIKFNAVWKKLRQFEPDFIATGHYAAIRNGQIFKPADVKKDQTYFLWGIDRNMLGKIIFPLGNLTKPEVRTIAQKFKLPTASKKDSQGICFVGPLKVRQFLQSEISSKPGEVLLSSGKVIGKHEGVEFYTIGQRLGLAQINWIGDVPPLYVIAKDFERKLLIVGGDHEVFASQFNLSQLNWLVDQPEKFEARVKIRYGQKDVDATVYQFQDRSFVVLSNPIRAITPGQSTVFYSQKGHLLGGGVIVDVPEQLAIIRKIRSR